MAANTNTSFSRVITDPAEVEKVKAKFASANVESFIVRPGETLAFTMDATQNYTGQVMTNEDAQKEIEKETAKTETV